MSSYIHTYSGDPAARDISFKSTLFLNVSVLECRRLGRSFRYVFDRGHSEMRTLWLGDILIYFRFFDLGGLDLAILEYAEYARTAILYKRNCELRSTPEKIKRLLSEL